MSATPITETEIRPDVYECFEGVFADLTAQRLFEQCRSLKARLDEGNDSPEIAALYAIATAETKRRAS